MPKELDNFAREMRLRRLAQGLSQEDLAEKTDVSIALIGNLERGLGNPTFQTLEKISGYFHATVADMIQSEADSESLSAMKVRVIASILRMNSHDVMKIAGLMAKL